MGRGPGAGAPERVIKRPVFEAVLQRASDYPYLDAQALPDVACVALNRMGSRYIRHAVDLAFYLTEKESTAMEEKLHDAVNYAFPHRNAGPALKESLSAACRATVRATAPPCSRTTGSTPT